MSWNIVDEFLQLNHSFLNELMFFSLEGITHAKFYFHEGRCTALGEGTEDIPNIIIDKRLVETNELRKSSFDLILFFSVGVDYIDDVSLSFHFQKSANIIHEYFNFNWFFDGRWNYKFDRGNIFCVL